MRYNSQNETENPDELIEVTAESPRLSELLRQSALRHNHLCPRQVLGARIGLYAGQVLNLGLPDEQKRLLTLVETDGCAADAISLATGCTVGNRRLRVLDYGKVAATFVDLKCDEAIRIVPRAEIREISRKQFPEGKSNWHAQLKAYKLMPVSVLLDVRVVKLSIPLDKLLSKPGYRVRCEECGEEIINERELNIDGVILCRACAGQSYYYYLESESSLLSLQPEPISQVSQ